MFCGQLNLVVSTLHCFLSDVTRVNNYDVFKPKFLVFDWCIIHWAWLIIPQPWLGWAYERCFWHLNPPYIWSFHCRPTTLKENQIIPECIHCSWKSAYGSRLICSDTLIVRCIKRRMIMVVLMHPCTCRLMYSTVVGLMLSTNRHQPLCT